MQIRALSDQRFSAESMQATLSPARQARAHHRHDLGTLTYVVLDDANGGIVRNLSHCGIGVQAVAPLRPQQIVPLRFELRNARLRIEAQGEVVWATASGQCGIRFLDLPPRMVRQINEWIFGSLLESIPQRWGRTDSIFGGVVPSSALVEEDDGLIISRASQNVIQLEPRSSPVMEPPDQAPTERSIADLSQEPDWLSRPLSARALAALVDGFIIIAALLLFSLVFLSVAHEFPGWPLSLGAALGATLFVAAFYWGFCRAFAGVTLGARLVRRASGDQEEQAEEADRFR